VMDTTGEERKNSNEILEQLSVTREGPMIQEHLGGSNT
jgi:hypothetical protein